MAVSKFEIYEYWKDKAITKEFEVKAVQDCTEEDEAVRVTELPDEVFCWGCGMPPYRTGQHRTIQALWNGDKLLQKAHIRPRFHGGKDQPENRFLLCPQCHTESPDTVNPRNFYAWAYYKRKHENWTKVLQRDLDLAARILNVDLNLAAKRSPWLMSESEVEYMRAEMRGRCGLHGSAYAPLTRTMAYLDWVMDDDSQQAFSEWRKGQDERKSVEHETSGI